MRKRIALFLLALAAFAPPALADEGSPLLSVDDLLALEDSYEAFLAELGNLLEMVEWFKAVMLPEFGEK